MKLISIKNVVETIQNFHDNNPLRMGIGIDLLKQKSELDELWFFEIMSMIEKEGIIKKIESEYAL